jgi:hypothetical protein
LTLHSPLLTPSLYGAATRSDNHISTVIVAEKSAERSMRLDWVKLRQRGLHLEPCLDLEEELLRALAKVRALGEVRALVDFRFA